MIAYCGLDCDTCPIRMATLEQDRLKQQALRAEIARVCTQQYGMRLMPQDVTDCDGCSSETGRLFSGCFQCEIRRCAMERKLASCAFCSDYACDRLVIHFRTDPLARDRLEEMRRAK